MALPTTDCDRLQNSYVETPEGKVARRVSNTPTQAEDVMYKAEPLLNGGSKEMGAVNGSVTPVDFTFSPAAGERFYIEYFTISIEDKGKMDPTAFGAIVGGLTNGVLISIQSKGVVHDMANLEDNADISNIFTGGATPTSTRWFDTDDAFIGSWLFGHGRMTLIGDDLDFVRFRIRDDLSVTPLDLLRATAIVWEVV